MLPETKKDSSACESRYRIPFVLPEEVPINYVPICPTLEQLSLCEKSVSRLSGEPGDLNNLTVQAAFDHLDHPDVYNLDFEKLDLEEQIYRSGKLYFMCQLLKKLEQNRNNLTDIQIGIITGSPLIERLLYDTFRCLCGYECIRISRIIQRSHHKLHGYNCGVIIRLWGVHVERSNAISEDETDFVFIYDADCFPKKIKLCLKSLFGRSPPPVLTLCSIGSPEFRLKSYLSMSPSFFYCSREILIAHSNAYMNGQFHKENDRFYADEFMVWNDAIAQQFVDWILNEDCSVEYKFVYPQAYTNTLE